MVLNPRPGMTVADCGIESQTRNDSRRLWQWIGRQLYGEKSRKAMVIKDPTSGKLCTDEVELCELWAQHYKKLGSKGDGHSKDFLYWEKFEVNKPQNKGKVYVEVKSIGMRT